MRPDVTSCVIPFSKLENEAFEYCKQENHISDGTPERRKEMFKKQAVEVWKRMKDADIQVDLVFVECDSDENVLFPKEWVEKHTELKRHPFPVCLYWLHITEDLPAAEKLSLQFLQDTWCSSVILAAKDKVEQYLMEDRWNTQKIVSVAPGIADLPLECMESWAQTCMETGIAVSVDSAGHIMPENSLFAAYIKLE